MRQILVAISFLTRLPAGNITCTAIDVGRSARWFPLVGALLGALYIGSVKLLSPFFPSLVTAVLIVALDALLTGALHLDGLADTADGFGAGRTRDDILRIMRDHAIGSYGAAALFLAMALKIAAIHALVPTAAAMPALLLMPVLGRWSSVFSAALAGYARPPDDDSARSVGTPARFVGKTELIIATLTAALAVVALRSWRSVIALFITAAIATGWTMLCRARIGGVTGDTLGAGIVIIECSVLLAFAAI
jgi:adenosylcobinamide-GDP ribazoletransferase